MTPVLFASLIALQSPLNYDEAFDRDCARGLVERSSRTGPPVDELVARIIARCSRPFRPVRRDSSPEGVEREIYETARLRFGLDILQQLVERREKWR